MQFDPHNAIVKLCTRGLELGGEDAMELFQKAWAEAVNDFEKFVSAHYIAGHQHSLTEKLKWDKIALNFALNIKDQNVKGSLSSLYLNIAKCYEDLNDLNLAKKHYTLALSFADYLADDGYGNMIKGGIVNGMRRLNKMEKRSF